MVSAASPLGRRPSDSPHRLHGRHAVAPSSDALRRHHPYHHAADGITRYDRAAVAPRPLRPSDASPPRRHHPYNHAADGITPYDRAAVAPRPLHLSDASPRRHHPYRHAADGVTPYDRAAVSPRPFHPSDASSRRHHPYHLAADGVTPYDRAAVSPRPFHPSAAPHRFPSDPTVTPSDARCPTPYDRPAVAPSDADYSLPLCTYKLPRQFSSDPTIIPGGPSCNPVAADTASSHLPVRRNRNREKIICTICNRDRNHSTPKCPFILLAFDGFIDNPPAHLRYLFFVIKETQGIYGGGIGFVTPLCLEDRERIPADAMRLHKDGANMVRITNLREDTSEPELLYDLFVKYGPVTNATVFLDKALAFVNFVREEDAQKAMKELNSCGLGYLMWATDSPEKSLL